MGVRARKPSKRTQGQELRLESQSKSSRAPELESQSHKAIELES